MEIKWFGHSCFQIKDKGGTLLIDPYSEKIGLKLPRLKPEIVLLSHHHFDHDDLSRLDLGSALVFDLPGEYETRGFVMRGIGTFHDKEHGLKRGKNTMFLIRTEGFSVLHAGDLGHLLLSDTLEALGRVDVLLIPVGGTYTIDAKEAAAITKEIEPRIVVPMHYKIPGLSLDIAGVDGFVKELGLAPEKLEKLTISSRTALPEEETKLVILSAS